MKTRKLISILLTPIMMLALTMSCSEDEGVTYEVRDVSSRISGFGSTVTGAGASLTINGTQLDKVLRVAIGNQVVAARLFTSVSESSITFNVPLSATLGTNNVLLVFPGPDRAYATIDVIPFQAISGFVPFTANTGETVTVFGANLSIVDEVKLGSVSATITQQAAGVLKFTMPAGAATGKITLVSEAGSANSAADLNSCSAPGIDCTAGLNLNTSFELGTGDNFDNWAKFNGGTKLVATTNVDGNEVFRGGRALRVIRDGTVVPATDQWRIQMASDLTATDIGASYTVYAYARASSAGASMRFSTQPAPEVYGGNIAIGTTWTRITFTFNATVANTRVVLDLNGAPITNFYFDDVKLIKN